MASTSKTVSQLIAQYYGDQFALAVEQIDVVIIVIKDNATIVIEDNTVIVDNTEPSHDDFIEPPSSENDDEEHLTYHRKQPDGSQVSFRAEGRWLLILVGAFCLIIALLLFGSETVMAILRLLVSVYRG